MLGSGGFGQESPKSRFGLSAVASSLAALRGTSALPFAGVLALATVVTCFAGPLSLAGVFPLAGVSAVIDQIID